MHGLRFFQVILCNRHVLLFILFTFRIFNYVGIYLNLFILSYYYYAFKIAKKPRNPVFKIFMHLVLDSPRVFSLDKSVHTKIFDASEPKPLVLILFLSRAIKIMYKFPFKCYNILNYFSNFLFRTLCQRQWK